MFATELRQTRVGAVRLVALALLVASVSAVFLWTLGHRWRAEGSGATPGRPLQIRAYPALTAGDIPDDVLARVLKKCRPDPSPERTANLAHYLLLWGADDGGKPGEFRGAELRDRALRPARYNSGALHYPLIKKTRYGARFDEKVKDLSPGELHNREAHVGQMLCFLGECGVPLDQRIETNEGSATLKEVFDDLAANFSSDEELDWATVALAIYLDPGGSWTTKYGATLSLDDVARKFLERPLGQGSPCGGTHTLYTMAVLLQADRDHRALSPATRGQVEAYLRRASERLAKVQAADGSWKADWAEDAPRAPIDGMADEGVWITGHQLDWMAIVPDGLRIGHDGLLRAARFLCEKTLAAEAAEIDHESCAFLHGPRAVRRLRGPSKQSTP